MALLAMATKQVDLLANALRRVRPNADEIGLIVDLAETLSELSLPCGEIEELGSRCDAAGLELVARAELMEKEIAAVAVGGVAITITKGDTLFSLAKEHGVTVDEIVAANEEISNPNKIKAGSVIIVPGVGAAPDPPDGGAETPSPSAGEGRVGSPQVGLTVQDFEAVAGRLGVQLPAIQAVAEVEAAGDGFLPSGRPKILFEGAQFARLTGGAYSGSHPHLSHPYGDSRTWYVGGEGEHDRLEEAMTLDSNAALQSASWGRFQIMGFNYQAAGYDTVEAYAEAMSVSEANHLEAFASFIEAHPTMHTALQNLDWATFAYNYNGPDYASNNYHIKMQEAYDRYAS